MNWAWSRRVKPSISWPNEPFLAGLLGRDSCRGRGCPNGRGPSQAVLAAGRTQYSRTQPWLFSRSPRSSGAGGSVACDDPFWPTLPCAVDPRVVRVDGGRERADSVLNALLHLHALGASDDDWVLVHDAARPNLAREDLDKLLGELSDDPVGGLLAVPARDTLKRVDKQGRVVETVDRQCIWQAFTPQMFRLGRAASCASR